MGWPEPEMTIRLTSVERRIRPTVPGARLARQASTESRRQHGPRSRPECAGGQASQLARHRARQGLLRHPQAVLADRKEITDLALRRLFLACSDADLRRGCHRRLPPRLRVGSGFRLGRRALVHGIFRFVAHTLSWLIWKDRPSSVFFTGPAPVRGGGIPEGANVGPDEAASTTNQADIRGLPRAEPHDRGSSGAASV